MEIADLTMPVLYGTKSAPACASIGKVKTSSANAISLGAKFFTWLSPFKTSSNQSLYNLSYIKDYGIEIWRRGWDSNPRNACTLAGFQDRCLQPLGHPSAGFSRQYVFIFFPKSLIKFYLLYLVLLVVSNVQHS